MNRAVAPEYKLAENIDIIIPQEIKLANDISLFWIKDVKDDSVKLDIEWFAGTKYQEKKLVAGFTNKLLLSGHATKSAKTIAAEIDFYGGFVHDEVDKDHAAITLFGLRENFHSIFSVFESAMLQCEFPEREFQEEKNKALTKFKIDSEKVKVICQRTFSFCLFGADHPYGQSATEEDFNALTRDDLQAYFKQYYLGTQPVLFLVGNVEESLLDAIRKWSENFTNTRPAIQKKNANPVLGRTYIERKDAIQSAIRIGRIAVDKSHPDYFALQILDTILGGYFGSRLMANIREDKGYTYGIGSAVAVLEDLAYFFITTEVAKEFSDQTVNEVYVELDRLKNERVPEDELERVKNYMLGEFLRHQDGPAAMMDSFKNIWFHQLPLTYYSDFIHAIHRTTASDLQEIANRYFAKEAMVEVIAG